MTPNVLKINYIINNFYKTCKINKLSTDLDYELHAHSGKYISNSVQIAMNIIVVTVFPIDQ